MDSPANESCPTIVGGQPCGKKEGGTGLPHGLESIVLLAAADAGFREEFSRNRETALKRADIYLTETEKRILQTIGDDTLLGIAKRFDSRRTPSKGGFRVTAASLAALASLTVSAPSRAESHPTPGSQVRTSEQLSLGSSAIIQELLKGRTSPGVPTDISYGIQPDTPTPTLTEPPVDGIRPDTPTPTLDPIRGVLADTPTPTDTIPVVTGILPDTPTPTHTLTATPMGIFPDTPTPTLTFTASPTHSDSATPTETATHSPSATPTLTETPIPSDTPTLTGTSTPSDTPTLTATPIPSDTPTLTLTSTPSDTMNGTSTPTPSSTVTPTPTRISADLDGNGTVDSRDLLLFLQEWYRTRTGPTGSQADALNLDPKD